MDGSYININELLRSKVGYGRINNMISQVKCLGGYKYV